MLSVGIDWAEDFHQVALGRPGEGVIEQFKLPHDPRAVDRLVARAGQLEPDSAEVRVVIETRHGLLVEALLDAGYTVLPVNPDLVARRRGPARKKDDAEDARIACLLGLDPFSCLKELIPHGELASELRSIARDDAQAAEDERRLLNRLRMDLLAIFPAALEMAGDDIGAPTFLHLLESWPTRELLATATSGELINFARRHHHGWPERFASRTAKALASDQFTARPRHVRAKADSIRLTAQQLLLIGQQRKLWGGGWDSCCSAPRTGVAPVSLRPATARRSLTARST